MATVALPRPIPPHRPDSTIGTPLTPPHSLDAAEPSASSSSQSCNGAVPNKHIPVCPTGPAKSSTDFDTPPSSPNSAEEYQQRSLLYPPDSFTRVDNGNVSIYEIDASQVAEALDFTSSQPLPPPSLVFPWFHGLHPQNHMQQTFFTGRRRSHRKTPSCLRGITLVKADGDLSLSRLKGAIAPDEFMQPGSVPEFVEADPPEGFSVRNFQIQPAKVALTSDIIVYNEDLGEARKMAWAIAAAQQSRRHKHGRQLPEYNTFICTSPFKEFEDTHEDIVCIDSKGKASGKILDFVHQERREMWDMTEASEISQNVFMGPSPEPASPEENEFDVLIECSDLGRLNPTALRLVAESERDGQSFHEFPSSGSILPPTWSHAEADGILETCKWIYHISHGTCPRTNTSAEGVDADGDSSMLLDEQDISTVQYRPRRVLIHCADGYTESTMLGIAYFSYSTGQPVPTAWLDLHTSKRRNFFAYPTDVALLTAIAPRLLQESPTAAGHSLDEIAELLTEEPKWLPGLDGSLPSRVLDYLYLGNLGHANNPDLLKELGICQLLSVGETASWREGDMEAWGPENVCVVQGVQDNGIDPLTDEFSRCLEFIDQGRRKGIATLVHCRVGVSRSATICIAEVMRTLDMSLPRAYCFVRARRLNVIIQPHLRFAYELLRWEATLQLKNDAGVSIKRELEWGEITREIALMNRPYSR